MDQSFVRCLISREVDIYVAVSHGRNMATALGFNAIDRTRIEIVILELTRNLLAHASGGTLLITVVQKTAQQGICIEAIDQGPGIENIELAMRDGYSTKHTLGAGLPSVRRLMDEFAIESTVGKGTRVKATKWLPMPRGGRK